MTYPTPKQMQADIIEFLDHDMCKKYRPELVKFLATGDAEGFSRLQDRIMAEQLAMTTEEIEQVDRMAKVA